MSLFYFLKVTLHDETRYTNAMLSAAGLGTPAAASAHDTDPQQQQQQQPAAQKPADEQVAILPDSEPLPTSPPPPPDSSADTANSHPGAGRARANATLLMLARNTDLAGALSSVGQMQDKFNKHCAYPWVFLNEEPFTEDFKRCVLPPSLFLPCR
jgi:alpha 1,2-mannosyltransferase